MIEVPLDNCSSSQGRAVTMNPEMYKLLNGELKQLYTAITRARVNLWIFDENPEKRAPAFKYFMKRKFVEVGPKAVGYHICLSHSPTTSQPHNHD